MRKFEVDCIRIRNQGKTVLYQSVAYMYQVQCMKGDLFGNRVCKLNVNL